jgi:glutamyl-tRNA reductase
LHIMVVGLNHRTAPVELREKLSFSQDELVTVLEQLRNTRSILESVVLSTCNRTEIYAFTTSIHAGAEYLETFLTKISGVEREHLVSHLYLYHDEMAVRHLFRVACGLDSMVLGETQILGQVRNAYFLAQETGNVSSIFHALFRKAVEVGKRAHTETAIGQNAVSVSYAAVELAKKIFADLCGKTVLIIGAGKMSELTAKHLNANGATRVMVVNRTYERARELADRFHGQALDMNSLELALKEADIVISSTGAQGYVVEKPLVASIMKKRRNRPLFFIDIAVPRDLDPELNKLDNVYLYDIDDLEHVIAANMEERAKEAEKIQDIIAEEMIAFEHWLNQQEVIPIITALREKAVSIQESVMDSLLHKLPNLTERDIRILQKHTMSIVNQMLREPILQLKQMAMEENAKQQLATACRLFGIDLEQEHGYAVKGNRDAVERQADGKETLETVEARNMSTFFGEARTVTTFGG